MNKILEVLKQGLFYARDPKTGVRYDPKLVSEKFQATRAEFKKFYSAIIELNRDPGEPNLSIRNLKDFE